MRGAADTTLQKDVKETQPLIFQPLTSPFDFLTVENEIIQHVFRNCNENFAIFLSFLRFFSADRDSLLFEAAVHAPAHQRVDDRKQRNKEDNSKNTGNLAGVQHLLHLKSKSKILRPIEIMGFFYEIFCQIQEYILL